MGEFTPKREARYEKLGITTGSVYVDQAVATFIKANYHAVPVAIRNISTQIQSQDSVAPKEKTWKQKLIDLKAHENLRLEKDARTCERKAEAWGLYMQHRDIVVTERQKSDYAKRLLNPNLIQETTERVGYITSLEMAANIAEYISGKSSTPNDSELTMYQPIDGALSKIVASHMQLHIEHMAEETDGAIMYPASADSPYSISAYVGNFCVEAKHWSYSESSSDYAYTAMHYTVSPLALATVR